MSVSFLCDNLHIIVFAVCSTSRDSINYDEYLDAGIPDTLLEGLGFYASSADAEVSPEADETPHERPVTETVETPQSLAAVSSTTTGKILSHVFKKSFVAFLLV